jgi:hypothetical protein
MPTLARLLLMMMIYQNTCVIKKAKNVPYASKNKKELQTKLEERRFKKEEIER